MTLEGAVLGIVWFANLALTFAYGAAWWIFENGITWGQASPVQVHLSAAGIGVLVSLFANLCVIFYFVGTGVWMRDRAREIYPHDKARGERMWASYEAANKLKGKAMPFPTICLILGTFTFVLGGATQVGAAAPWIHKTLATIYLVASWMIVRLSRPAMVLNVGFLNSVSAEIDAVSANEGQ